MIWHGTRLADFPYKCGGRIFGCACLSVTAGRKGLFPGRKRRKSDGCEDSAPFLIGFFPLQMLKSA